MGYRYIGAKTKVSPKILAKVQELVPPGGRVIDLMAGTGAVSAELRRAGFSVTACDLMTFSYHHCRVALMFTMEPDFARAQQAGMGDSSAQARLFGLSGYESLIDYLNSLPPVEGYFTREFSRAGHPLNGADPRNYFSPANARRIDAIRLTVRELWQTGRISDLEHSLLIHDLIMAANDVANIAGTYGHYLSLLRGRAVDELRMVPTPLLLIDDAGRHQVLQGYAEQLAPTLRGDLCYIDPPYMKRQYAANYHILETLAREDEPQAVGVSGLRPWRDQYSDFCSKVRIRDAFACVIGRIDCDRFLISYSDEGLLSIQELMEFLTGFGRISLSRFPYKRFKSRRENSRDRTTEYILDLRRRG